MGKNVADKVELVLGRMGIPVYCEGGGDPMTSDEVDQVLQHLTLLDNLANDVALLSELRSPLFELSERELAAIRLLRPQREASFLSALQAAAHEDDAPLDARCRAVLDALEAERFYARSSRWPNTCGVFSSAADFMHITAHSLAESCGRQICACSVTGPTLMSRATRTGLAWGFVEAVRADGGGGGEQSPRRDESLGGCGARDDHPQIQGTGISHGVCNGAGRSSAAAHTDAHP